MWLPMLFMSVQSLVVVALCGQPLALGCQRLWRQGYHRAAWTAGIGLGTVAVAASLVVGSPRPYRHRAAEPPGLDRVVVAPTEQLRATSVRSRIRTPPASGARRCRLDKT